MQTIRLQSVKLQDVGPFSNLEINIFNGAGLCLICGDNGIGKSTILEAIAALFSQGQLQRLKRRQAALQGSVSGVVSSNSSTAERSMSVQEFEPDKNTWLNGPFAEWSRGVINVRAARDIFYMQQNSITRDPVIDSHNDLANRLANGLNGGEIKQWFTSRYLLRNASMSSWTEDMLENVDLAESFFSLLDPQVKLDRVDVKTFDIILSTPSGLLPFEYMSSGFRSAFFLLLGIVKEIEYRGLNVSAKEFSGLILIDELDLHLHPAWQRDIGSRLKQAFPNAQIIASTHSPHIIQSAQASEVIALVREEAGLVRPRVVASTTYGFAGWTVEEVLEDIMGVKDTKTHVYRSAMQDFDKALDSEDPEAVMASLLILREMLHPNSASRKLLEIQAAPYIGAASQVGSEN